MLVIQRLILASFFWDGWSQLCDLWWHQQFLTHPIKEESEKKIRKGKNKDIPIVPLVTSKSQQLKFVPRIPTIVYR